jgi:hypothetical protein
MWVLSQTFFVVGYMIEGRDRLYGNRIIGISTALISCIRDSKPRFSIYIYLFAHSSLSLISVFLFPRNTDITPLHSFFENLSKITPICFFILSLLSTLSTSLTSKQQSKYKSREKQERESKSKNNER